MYYIENKIGNKCLNLNVFYYGKPKVTNYRKIPTKLDKNIYHIVTGNCQANTGYIGISINNAGKSDVIGAAGEIEFFNNCNINNIPVWRVDQSPEYYSKVLKDISVQRHDFFISVSGSIYFVDVKTRDFLKDGLFFLNWQQIASYRHINNTYGKFVLACIKAADLKPFCTPYYLVQWSKVEKYLSDIGYDEEWYKKHNEWIKLPYEIMTYNEPTHFLLE